MAVKELTYGNPLKLILFFMFPIFIGNVFQQLYHFADALIVSRTLGIEALAAIGATTALIFLVISFIFSSTQGFTIITAQKFGARDYSMVRKSLCASFILSFILTAVLTLISAPFTKLFLLWLRTPADIISMASDYLFIMFAGIFATVFYNLSANIIRALGDSKTPLYFLIVAAITNVILDILFIVKFGLGVKGAGYATVISQAIATVLCVSFMFWKFKILHISKHDWDIPFSYYYEHLRVGIPMGFQMSVLSLGILALQFVLNSFGPNAIAAYTTSMRIEQIFSQTFVALGATMAVYTAQNYGANKISRIKQGVKAAMGIVLSICTVSITVLYLFSKPIISIFMTEINQEVLSLAQEYLHIIVIFFVFLGALLVFRNILQGMGKVIAPLLSGVAELIARTVFSFVFGYYFGFTGICTATPAAWISAAIILFISYKISLVKFIKRRSI